MIPTVYRTNTIQTCFTYKIRKAMQKREIRDSNTWNCVLCSVASTKRNRDVKFNGYMPSLKYLGYLHICVYFYVIVFIFKYKVVSYIT